MGVGDINGDGRMDIVNNRGWWEQPASGAGDTTWKFHPENFGSGGAEMGIYDVNGDGLNDIVTSIAAHGWGQNILPAYQTAEQEEGDLRRCVEAIAATALTSPTILSAPFLSLIP